MKFSIQITDRARTDIDGIWSWINDRAPAAALRWYDGITAAIASLAVMPESWPRAPEFRRLGIQARNLIFGNYRVIFVVKKSRVVVLHVRHGRRRRMRRQDIT